MLVNIMEIEVFVDLLLPMEGGRMTGDSRKVIRKSECAFALFKVFQSGAFRCEAQSVD